jgi:preprotein translocase SecF subunit
MIQFFKNTKYDFLRWGPHAVIASSTFILAGVVSIFLHGGLNLSIDFVGGTLVQMKFENPVRQDIGKIRSIIDGLGYGAPEVKTAGPEGNNELQITVRKKSEGTVVSDAIKSVMAEKYPGNRFEMRKIEMVGPKIGGELKKNSIIAAILSLIGILIYVGARFNPPFGVAAIIPLFHDGLVTLMAFSMLNYEMSLTFIAALLTILGFSINDTIVIMDRIRENIKGGLRGRKFKDIVNSSINQTLSRTIITTLTTLICTAALFFIAGEGLKEFSFALLIGFTVGVYSTVYIAGVLLVWWHERWPIVK